MFWKRLGLLGFLLTTLMAHLIFGQDNSHSLLVICFGDNGHVAMEALDLSHHTQNPSLPDAHALEPIAVHAHEAVAPKLARCKDTQSCHDIVLALGHDDHMVLPTATLDWGPLHEAAYTLQRFLTPYPSHSLTLPVSVARISPDNPQDFGTPSAITAQHETLSHTILLI